MLILYSMILFAEGPQQDPVRQQDSTSRETSFATFRDNQTVTIQSKIL